MEKGIDFTGVSIVYFCHDGNGRVLMSKRGKKCRDEHGRWDCGAGGLEYGHTVEDTLKKEIKEEYCTDVINYEFLGYRDVHREENGIKSHWVALDFRVQIDPDKVENGEPHKFDSVEWFSFDNLPNPLHSQCLIASKLYKDKL